MEKLTMMEGVSKRSAQWKTRVGSRFFFEIFETALESVPDSFFFLPSSPSYLRLKPSVTRIAKQHALSLWGAKAIGKTIKPTSTRMEGDDMIGLDGFCGSGFW